MYPSDSSNTQPKKETNHATLTKLKSTKKAVNRTGHYSHNFYSDSYYDDMIDEEDDDYNE